MNTTRSDLFDLNRVSFRFRVADLKTSAIYSLSAAAAFHLAWSLPAFGGFVLVYAFFLIRLSQSHTARVAFRFGFLTGFVVFAPQLAWLWNIFGPVSICLWSVLSFCTGMFVVVLHLWRSRFGSKYIWIAAPILWTGFEFFRGELYALRFSWLSVGYAFAERPGLLPLGFLGIYGTGFLVFMLAGLAQVRAWASIAIAGLLTLLVNLPAVAPASASVSSVKLAGIQLEFPPDLEVPGHLDRVLTEHPDAQILVLSEYSFDGPVPRHVQEWCRRNNRYLVAGAKDESFDSGKSTFHNTAFVVGPSGEIVFKHAKSVPIQFFNDGLPAESQKVWNSPWGKIAIPICYDLSYRRVMDRFIQVGAQAFIVPFMDVTEWGEQQHQLHTRIAPVRAREYGVPIFRLGSSGISQHVDSNGDLLGSLGFPGQEQVLAGTLQLASAPRLPFDHWLAPLCSLMTLFTVLFFFIQSLIHHRCRAAQR